MAEQRDEQPKVPDLMQALFDSVEKAKAERRRVKAEREGEAPDA